MTNFITAYKRHRWVPEADRWEQVGNGALFLWRVGIGKVIEVSCKSDGMFSFSAGEKVPTWIRIAAIALAVIFIPFTVAGAVLGVMAYRFSITRQQIIMYHQLGERQQPFACLFETLRDMIEEAKNQDGEIRRKAGVSQKGILSKTMIPVEGESLFSVTKWEEKIRLLGQNPNETALRKAIEECQEDLDKALKNNPHLDKLPSSPYVDKARERRN